MASVRYYLRSTKTDPSSILGRLYFKGQEFVFSTGYSVSPKNWNQKSQRVSAKERDSDNINSYLAEKSAWVLAIHDELKRTGTLTKESIQKRISNEKEPEQAALVQYIETNLPTKESFELSIIHDIHEIRGIQVMLDFDLAKRYEVETGALNQAVKRNMRRFPSDFMFQLTKQEFETLKRQNVRVYDSEKQEITNLKSQFVISSYGGRRHLPYAFTEQGIAMLSPLLNSYIAIDTSILIMRAFVVIRQYALNYAELKRELENFMKATNMQFNDIYKVLDMLVSHKKEIEKPRNPIGFRLNN